ncbi:DJ-1/PfpI family protein [Proteus terrae]|uniref:DJ-1 family protein n=1 Tax=Proteus terrae subsp. cibarius TaxID=626774 RepID=A0ABX6JIA1_9GAMM|nr:DJ-1/PfpI family protein [Proteus terrae]QGW04070.1 DJ-1/PfpI family protein [Proteus terrae subsp. cibarius]QIF88924.1 DJ-1 family protein [Proteus terrae subsp. cibarius]QKD68637.1 DJ-1/PfpI family protein [Proteus terrae subsp. cibarius]QKD73811.1 DJ-1/PfpI family protein [Proteus terrae subsp. cibarius]UDF25085.1 DJ-1/PfpI family protein [Proteus terrae subsp. cibarius]
MKQVAVLLADGFEEGEAVVFIDIMRRLDIHVDVLSCMDTLVLNTYFETKISADFLLTEKLTHSYDAIMMPGGPKGTDRLCANEHVIQFIKHHIAEDKYICALCSSGAKVLAAHHLLEGRNYSTGDKLADKYDDGHYLDQDVVVDGKFISAKGLGVSFEFAFTVARHLLSDNTEKVDWQANHIYFKHWPLDYLK